MLKRFAFAVLVAALFQSSAALAICPFSGCAAMAPTQTGLAPTVSTKLTVPRQNNGAPPNYATLCAYGAAVYYETDGRLATTASDQIPAGQCVPLLGGAVIVNTQVLSATGTVIAKFFQ